MMLEVTAVPQACYGDLVHWCKSSKVPQFLAVSRRELVLSVFRRPVRARQLIVIWVER